MPWGRNLLSSHQQHHQRSAFIPLQIEKAESHHSENISAEKRAEKTHMPYFLSADWKSGCQSDNW